MAEKKQRKKKPTLKDQISELNSQVNDEKDIFCEYSAGYILAIDQKNKEEAFSLLNKDQINFLSIGQVKLNTFEINSKKFDYSDILDKYYKNFAKIIN